MSTPLHNYELDFDKPKKKRKPVVRKFSVNLRLTKTEKESVKEQAKMHGLCESEYIRSLIKKDKPAKE